MNTMKLKNKLQRQNNSASGFVVVGVMLGLITVVVLFVAYVNGRDPLGILEESCDFCIEGRNGKFVFVLSESLKRHDLPYLKSESLNTCVKERLNGNCTVIIFDDERLSKTAASDFTDFHKKGMFARFDWLSDNRQILCPLKAGERISQNCL